MDFNPNEKKRPAWPFATFVPRRKPQFKVHHKRNHAAAALTTYMEGIMYEWVGEEWTEIQRLEDPRCCLCTPSEWAVVRAGRYYRPSNLSVLRGTRMSSGPWYCSKHFKVARADQGFRP